MKKSIIMILVLAGILTLSLDSVMANVPYAPDLPALPEDDFLCADVNEDGTVNVLDIISMVNYILGGSPDPFNLAAADVNADDAINVLDIIAIVNIILETPGIPCSCIPSVDYEGKTYSTVQIDEQCWFRENLDVGTMINSNTGGQLQTDNDVIEKYCYGNIAANCDTYGGLYEWNEAMQYVSEAGAQGICPVDWHIPTDDEWKILEGTVDSQFGVGDPEWDQEGLRGFDAGGNLKEAGMIHWNAPNTGATNLSGFSGLPGGYRANIFGQFDFLGNTGRFWSSSQSSSINSCYRTLVSNDKRVSRYNFFKEYGYSVRCLKGCWPDPTQADAGPDQMNVPGTSAILAGNTPDHGTGSWTIVTGTGGTIVDPSNPASEFLGEAGNDYILSWTIITVCGFTTDLVSIGFAPGSSFICGTNVVDNRDGQTYPTVQIGTQCWMVKEMNIGTMILSNTGGQLQTDNGTIEKYCYDNVAENCDTYGGLYEWPEAMQYVTTEGAQGICPPGWHIPTDWEWTTLEGTVDTQYPPDDPEWNAIGWRGFDAGSHLKEAGETHWNPPNIATNSSGFTALPGGIRSFGLGNFQVLGWSSYLWASSQFSPESGWQRQLFSSLPEVYRTGCYKLNGISVRCLKD